MWAGRSSGLVAALVAALAAGSSLRRALALFSLNRRRSVHRSRCLDAAGSLAGASGRSRACCGPSGSLASCSRNGTAADKAASSCSSPVLEGSRDHASAGSSLWRTVEGVYPCHLLGSYLGHVSAALAALSPQLSVWHVHPHRGKHPRLEPMTSKSWSA